MRRPSSLRLAISAVALVGFLATGLAGSARAEDERVNWKMGSAFGSRLTQLGTLGISLSNKIERVSGGNIRLKFYEPNALVPPLEMFDAVAKGELDAAWSKPDFWVRKDKAFALFSAVPFGPRAAEYAAWIYYGGGAELMDEIYAAYGIKSIVCGVVAPEAAGWFRKEINSVDDLKGLRMRFFGLGAKVMAKLGVETEQLLGSNILPALESGAIDATEFSLPAIDMSLGFHRVTSHYYFPGWHQQSSLLELMMNREKWDALSDTQRAQIEIVCGDNFREGLAEGEALQIAALATLKEKGVTFHRLPLEVLEALNQAWLEVASEIAASSENFKRVWESFSAFRDSYKVWNDLGYL